MENNELQAPPIQLSEEDKRIAQDRKLQLFKKNGYPMPIGPVVSSGNPAILNKIQQIKLGLKKGEFNEIVNKDIGPATIPVNTNVSLSKNKQQQRKPAAPNQKQAIEPLFSAAPQGQTSEFNEIERMFEDTSSSYRSQINSGGRTANGTRINEMAQATDEEGLYAAQEIKSKFYNNLQEKYGINPVSVQNHDNSAPMVLPAGTILINEEDLKKKIVSLSSQVAKKISEQMIRSVLSEYLNQSKSTIVESQKIKKAEVIGENMVKIEGKAFKLVPVSIKPKQS